MPNDGDNSGEAELATGNYTVTVTDATASMATQNVVMPEQSSSTHNEALASLKVDKSAPDPSYTDIRFTALEMGGFDQTKIGDDRNTDVLIEWGIKSGEQGTLSASDLQSVVKWARVAEKLANAGSIEEEKAILTGLVALPEQHCAGNFAQTILVLMSSTSIDGTEQQNILAGALLYLKQSGKEEELKKLTESLDFHHSMNTAPTRENYGLVKASTAYLMLTKGGYHVPLASHTTGHTAAAHEGEFEFYNILNDETILSPEEALDFVDYIRDPEAFDETEGHLNQNAFWEAVCTEVGAPLDGAINNPEVGQKYAACMMKVREAIYNYGKENADDPNILNECSQYLEYLSAPVEPPPGLTEEEMLTFQTGLGLPESPAEINGKIEFIKDRIDALFASNNQNIIRTLEQCVSLNDPTTLRNIGAMIQHITGIAPTINVNDTPLPPDNPIDYAEDGSIIIYSNHEAFQNMPFPAVLSNFLAVHLSMTDPYAAQFVTPQYIANLIAPHKGIVGTKPVKDPNNPEEQPDAQSIILPTLFQMLTAETEEDMSSILMDTIMTQGGALLNGFSDNIAGAVGDNEAVDQLKQQAMGSFFDFLPNISDILVGFVSSIKSFLGIGSSFNDVAANTDTPSNQIKLNGGDITQSGNNNQDNDQPQNKVQNVQTLS